MRRLEHVERYDPCLLHARRHTRHAPYGRRTRPIPPHAYHESAGRARARQGVVAHAIFFPHLPTGPSETGLFYRILSAALPRVHARLPHVIAGQAARHARYTFPAAPPSPSPAYPCAAPASSSSPPRPFGAFADPALVGPAGSAAHGSAGHMSALGLRRQPAVRGQTSSSRPPRPLGGARLRRTRRRHPHGDPRAL